MNELSLEVIQRRPEGPRRAQAARCPDGDRDRARRRDGERHLRPHRHDQGRLRHDLPGLVPEHGRRGHRQAGVRAQRQQRRRTRQLPGDGRSPRSGRCRTSPRPSGRSSDRPRSSSAPNGKADPNGGAPNLGFSHDATGDTRFNPLTLVSGRWPLGADRGRDRQGHCGQEGLTRSATRSVVQRSGPVQQFRITGIAELGVGRLDRRRHPRDLRPADRAAAVRQGRPARPDPRRRRSRASSRQPARLARSSRSCRPTAEVLTGADQAAAGREGHDELVPQLPPVLPARVRRDRALRRRLRDREHALDHDRAAHARVRDAADARCDRRQMLGSVFLEALVIGTVASIVGLFLGLALAKGLNALFVSFGIDLPKSALVFARRTVIVSLAARDHRDDAREPPPRVSRHPRAADRGGARGQRAAAASLRPLDAAAVGRSSRRSRSRCPRLRRSSCTASRRRSGCSRSASACSCSSSASPWSRRSSCGRSRRSLGWPGAEIGGARGQARARELDAQPAAHRVHRRGADDRARARHLRRRARRRASEAPSRAR